MLRECGIACTPDKEILDFCRLYLFTLGSLSPSWLFLKSNTALKPDLGGWGWGGGGRMQPRNYSVHMKRLSQTESPIFVILCVLCFRRKSFFTFILPWDRNSYPTQVILPRVR